MGIVFQCASSFPFFFLLFPCFARKTNSSLFRCCFSLSVKEHGTETSTLVARFLASQTSSSLSGSTLQLRRVLASITLLLLFATINGVVNQQRKKGEKKKKNNAQQQQHIYGPITEQKEKREHTEGKKKNDFVESTDESGEGRKAQKKNRENKRRGKKEKTLLSERTETERQHTSNERDSYFMSPKHLCTDTA